MYWYVTFIHMVLSVDVKEAKQIPQTMQRLYTQLHTYCSDDNRNDVCDGLWYRAVCNSKVLNRSTYFTAAFASCIPQAKN